MARAVAFAVVLVALVASAHAYPSLWAQESHVKCPDHPVKDEAGHKAPKLDSTIKFATADGTGKAATSVCPGDTVTLKVTFAEPRLGLLTADAGTFAKASAKCPSRQVMDRTTGYKPDVTQTAQLKVPCGLTAPITVKVTSASGSTSAFFKSSITLPINPACAAKKLC